jgi:hypothetical protein
MVAGASASRRDRLHRDADVEDGIADASSLVRAPKRKVRPPKPLKHVR